MFLSKPQPDKFKMKLGLELDGKICPETKNSFLLKSGTALSVCFPVRGGSLKVCCVHQEYVYL